MDKRLKTILLLVPLMAAIPCRENIFSRITIANLKAAVKGELRNYKKYTDYARKAREEGYGDLGLLFDSISGLEKQHAMDFMETLEKYGIKMDPFEMIDYGGYPMGSSLENLRYSIKAENRHIYEMYERYAKTARDEKMPDAADAFSKISDLEIKEIKLLDDYFITIKPAGKNKKAAIGTTRRMNFSK